MISGQAFVSPEARLAPDVEIGPFVFVGGRVRIGPGCRLAPGVVLEDCELGCRVRVGANTVIGCDGFGYRQIDDRHVPVPHRGRVVIEDDVDIGPNCTVARARETVTRIGAGTKIDALVHVGHNVIIGRNCIIVAQVGIAGSVRIGDGVSLAGQTGVRDHVTIGDNSVLYAKSALYRSVPAGSRYSGIPARPHRETLAAQARLNRLSRLRRDRDRETGRGEVSRGEQ